MCVCVIQLVQAENEEKESCCERFLSVLSLSPSFLKQNQYAALIKQKEGCSPVHRMERGEQQAVFNTTEMLLFSCSRRRMKTLEKSLMDMSESILKCFA